MLSSWFGGALACSGHRDITDYSCFRRTFTGLGLLQRLKREEHLHYAITLYGNSHSMKQSSVIMFRLVDGEIVFREWTSFRDSDNLYFAFLQADDAVRFRLMWG